MKALIITLLLTLVSNLDYAQSIEDLIPNGFEISQMVEGHLNEDTLSDRAILIHRPDEADSQQLLVLFKNENGGHKLSLQTSDFITLRYYNQVSIDNKKLILEVEHPWNGPNFMNYLVKFAQGDWVLVSGSSDHATGGYFVQENWKTKFDFEKGEYEIAHVLYLSDGSEVTKRIKGVIKNSKPKSITNGEAYRLSYIKHVNDTYYLGNRNSLFSEEELHSFIPTQYRTLMGVWNHLSDERIKLSFHNDLSFEFKDYNHSLKREEWLSGDYGIESDTITLNYGDRPAQKFKLVELNGTFHITKVGGFDFIKEEQ